MDLQGRGQLNRLYKPIYCKHSNHLFTVEHTKMPRVVGLIYKDAHVRLHMPMIDVQFSDRDSLNLIFVSLGLDLKPFEPL